MIRGSAHEALRGQERLFGLPEYPCQMCISVNEQVVHGLAGAGQLRLGDIVSLDVGVIYNGFIGDTARRLRWAVAGYWRRS